MSGKLALIGQDNRVRDYLDKIGEIFNAEVKLRTADEGAGKPDDGSRDILRSSSLTLDGRVIARLDIYSKNNGVYQIGSQELVTIEKLIINKLADTYDITGLYCELSDAYDDMRPYQKLGDQILQPENAAESYNIILTTAESLLNTGKSAIFLMDAENECLKAAAYREHGKSVSAEDGGYLLDDKYLKKTVNEQRLINVPSGHCCTFHSEKDGGDITFNGPLLAAPIIRRHKGVADKVTGLIIATVPDSRNADFTLNQTNNMTTLATFAAITGKHFESLETTRLAKSEIDNMLKELLGTFESLQQHTALIEHVNQVSLKINSTLNLDAIFDSIAEYSRNLLTCQAVVVGVMARRGMVSFPSVAGVSVERREKLVDLNELPVIQKTFNEAQIIIVNGYDQNKHGLGMELPIEIRNFIVYPIVSKSNVAAVIIALNKEDGRGNLFTATDGELLKTLAGQAANAIENGRLLNNVTQTQITMMTKLAALAEKRDPETGEHLLRMQKYSRIIAQELAKTKQYASVIDERFVNDLYVASPLHDIGKVGISDNILLKPGKLTEEEFDIMRSHTTIGAEILLGPAYLEMAADIAHCHHERWDGSGYPRNLAGENIPLCSRIVTVADVYDALTSRRVYKECFSHEIAVQTLTEGRGTNFDPMVLDAFNAGLSNVLHIKNLIR